MNFSPFMLVFVLSLTVNAHAAEDVYVPSEIQNWSQWVLYEQEQLSCPMSGNMRTCVWPGRLQLEVKNTSGHFSQQIDSVVEQYFMLPGNRDNWPLDVTLNGQPVPVVERQQRPAIKLQVGKNTVEGLFAWNRLPDTLALANGTGLISLSVNDDVVNRPRWNHQMVWIQQGQSNSTEEKQNQISVAVHRMIVDGAPAEMIVQLQIDIAGESREEIIGRLVPEGFQPASMSAPLPARLDDSGNLKIQARPGSFVFQFIARAPGPLNELTFSPAGEHWPKEEVWSYRADPGIRTTEVQGASPVDPVQAGVPNQWHNAPAYRMTPGDKLTIVERQRGRAAGESNRLSLRRELWLDFDRGGYTTRDQLTGSVVRDWRLDMRAPFELESARLWSNSNDQVDLLVTALAVQNGEPANPQRGVEIRTPQLNMQALARLNQAVSVLPVSGWETRLDDVQTTLFLPPGHRLFAVANVDSNRDSWTASWNLLDFFLVLIVTVAAWRLFTPTVSVVALLALVLSLHEPGAPQWAWLNLIIAFAVASYLPGGQIKRMARVYTLLSIVGLAILLLPFVARELRAAVFPQLEPANSQYYEGSIYDSASAPSRVSANQRAKGIQLERAESLDKLGSRSAEVVEEVIVTATKSTGSKRNVLNRYDTNVRVQTGPGVPSWSWHRYQLSWSGPIEADQTTRLWIVPPWLMRVWRILMVGLMVALLGAIARQSFRTQRVDRTQKKKDSGVTNAVVAACAALIICGGVSEPSAHAQTPDVQILEELGKRLRKPPDCAPRCVDVSRARVQIRQGTMNIELIAHAQVEAVLDLPGQAGVWMPTTVRLNARATDQVRLEKNGRLKLRLPAGVHRIELSGELPNANSVVVSFPAQPRHIVVDSESWEVTGVSDNRLSGGSLSLIRQQTENERATLDAIDVEQFPVFVEVRRQLFIDLDWSVETTVTRRTPPNAAINLQIPLLTGESVTQDNVQVKNGVASVSLSAGVGQISWTSTLDRVPGIVLQAKDNAPWQEHWQVQAGASWRLQHIGVPELNINRELDETWTARFTPWPGETLRLNISRPTAIDGATMAIDTATLAQSAGKRSSDSVLDFSYRATRGSQHLLSLPQDSELTAVRIDNQPLNLALKDGQLRLPVVPGEHQVSIEWRSSMNNALHTLTDPVDLGTNASNLTTRLTFTANRWVLWTHGPRLGPAVLYWSELLLLIGLAYVLGKFGRTPLKTRHWLLLGLGFSTFFWPAFVMVAVALLALAWREKNILSGRFSFNATQVLLVGLTITASVALITTIPYGLLGTPDMHVTGNNSSATYLNWFIDQSSGLMPEGGVFTLPIWMYKSLILIWALWLAFAILRWLPWMWSAYSQGGYWKAKTVVRDK